MSKDQEPASSDPAPVVAADGPLSRPTLASGCLSAFLFTVGLALLLPGLFMVRCVIEAEQAKVQLGGLIGLVLVIALVILAFGAGLIWLAVRRAGH